MRKSGFIRRPAGEGFLRRSVQKRPKLFSSRLQPNRVKVEKKLVMTTIFPARGASPWSCSAMVKEATAVGAAILNAIVARTVELIVEAGGDPPVFRSANVDGGDEYNREMLERFRDRIFYMGHSRD